jgi:glucan endo-1,6-beta-glucosidase
MNEPLNYQGGYPCMFLDPVDAASLIAQGLGQAMHDRGVIIMAYVSLDVGRVLAPWFSKTTR